MSAVLGAVRGLNEGHSSPPGSTRSPVPRKLAREREAAGDSIGPRRAGAQAASPPAVEIDVADASEGGEVVECLWRHGILATLLEQEALWTIEVRSPREEPSRLLADVAAALQPWLACADRSQLVLRVGAGRYTLRRQPGARGSSRRGGRPE